MLVQENSHETDEATNPEPEEKEIETQSIDEVEKRTVMEEPTTETETPGIDTNKEVEENITQEQQESEAEKKDPIKEVEVGIEVTEKETKQNEEISTENLTNGIAQATAEIKKQSADQNKIEIPAEHNPNEVTETKEGLASKSSEDQVEESSTSKSTPVLSTLEVDLLLRNGEKEKECKNLQNSGKK
jgi:hypothetical protein